MKYQVIIIGGGPSGISCAIKLQKIGVSNCIIEKTSFPRKKLCGGLVTSKTYTTISELLNDDSKMNALFAGSQNTDEVAFFDGETLLSKVKASEVFRIIDRESFDNFLVNYYSEIGGTIFTNVKITSLDFDNKKIKVASGDEFNYDVLVAADGANSQIRRLSSKKLKKIGFCLENDFAQSEKKNYLSIYFNILDKGYGWRFPTKSGNRTGFGNLYQKGFNYLELFEEYLLKTQTVNNCENVKAQGAFVPYGGCLRKPYFKDSVIFVGDAAGFVDPIYGEGLFYSFLSGKIAAEAIIDSENKSLTRFYAKQTKPIRKQIFWGLMMKRIFFAKLFQRYFLKRAFSHKQFISFYLDNQVSTSKYQYSNLIKLFVNYKKSKH